MGIPGLLPVVKPVCRQISVEEYKGKRVAIDTYSWLHKGSYSCSSELCQNIPTTKYITYCMNMIKMLQYYRVTPVMVFDGAYLPMKKDKEHERADSRKQNREKAVSLLKFGNRKAAEEYFRKAVDITPEIAHRLIQTLRDANIEYIVAPYEADAQLAYLARINYVDAIITEDSDLIPYGAHNILFKMDKYGTATEFKRENLKANTKVRFYDFDSEMVIRMCVLSGCDYLSSLPGIGVKTAHKIVKQCKTIKRIVQKLRLDLTAKIPPSYEDEFVRAELTFKHQRVYDPINKEVRPLNDLPDSLRDQNTDFLGPPLPQPLSERICKAIVHPITHETMEQPKKQKIKMQPKSSIAKSLSKSKNNSIHSYLAPVPKTVTKQFVPPKRKSSQDSYSSTPPNDDSCDELPSSPTLVQSQETRNYHERSSKTIIRSKYFATSPLSKKHRFIVEETNSYDSTTDNFPKSSTPSISSSSSLSSSEREDNINTETNSNQLSISSLRATYLNSDRSFRTTDSQNSFQDRKTNLIESEESNETNDGYEEDVEDLESQPSQSNSQDVLSADHIYREPTPPYLSPFVNNKTSKIGITSKPPKTSKLSSFFEKYFYKRGTTSGASSSTNSFKLSQDSVSSDPMSDLSNSQSSDFEPNYNSGSSQNSNHVGRKRSRSQLSYELFETDEDPYPKRPKQ